MINKRGELRAQYSVERQSPPAPGALGWGTRGGWEGARMGEGGLGAWPLASFAPQLRARRLTSVSPSPCSVVEDFLWTQYHCSIFFDFLLRKLIQFVY